MSTPNQSIGGFFGLELPMSMGLFPPADAGLFQSGRSCLRAILDIERPKRFVAPYYVCDAALAPARAAGIPIQFYGLDRDLQPILPQIAASDAVLVVDYFGLCGRAVARMAELCECLIVDQTQALFAGGSTKAWRFTSARKWFGVPDGAFLWGPREVPTLPAVALDEIPLHLVERLWGDRARAYQCYLDAEARFEAKAAPISTASIAILRGVDAARVRTIRRENFALVEERLGPHNALDLPMGPDDVPFCYPFLPHRRLNKALLAEANIFVPTFWTDCADRAEEEFSWEVDLSNRLLPLPVDHRYGPAEMRRLTDQVLRLLEEG